MKLILANSVNNIKVVFLKTYAIILGTGGKALKRRRTLIYIAMISLMLISCSKIIMETSRPQGAVVVPGTPEKDKAAAAPTINEIIRAVTIKNLDSLNLETIKETNFNMVALQSEGVRKPDKKYSTDFRTLKRLNKNTAELEKNNINYYIEITSGPGFSQDSSISSLFSNKAEKIYFAKMLEEIAGRYYKNKHFTGISINLNSQNIREKDYYETLINIISDVRKHYPDLIFIFNLHTLSFEGNLKNVPELKLQNVIINLPIEIKDFSYPGTSRGVISEFELDKNILLKALQSLKESDYKTVMVTTKLAWTEDTDVFIQDLYEINKMLGFNNNICYGNTGDEMDFSRSDSLLKQLKRHNQ